MTNLHDPTNNIIEDRINFDEEDPGTSRETTQQTIETLQSELRSMKAQYDAQADLLASYSRQLDQMRNPPITNSASPNGNPNNPEDVNTYLLRASITGLQVVDRIENYTGGIDYDMFIDAIQFVAQQHQWSRAVTLQVIETKLRGRAKEYYLALKLSERPQTVEGFRTWMKSLFSKPHSREEARRELARCIRQSDETLGAYVHRLKVISNRVFPEDVLTTAQMFHRDRMIVEQFLQGIDLRLANKILSTGDYYRIEEAIVIAEDYEAVIGRQMEENCYEAVRSSIRAVQAKDANASGTGRTRDNRNTTRTRRPAPEKEARTPFNQKYPKMQGRCWNCLGVGHVARGCNSPTERPICYHCVSIGRHSTKECSLNSREASELRRN